jgi:hypothetical protein
MSEKSMGPIHPMQDRRRISFLLRLWRPSEGEGSDWQSSLEIPGTGKRIGFTSPEQLFAYLMDLGERSGSDHGIENEK